MRPSPISCRTDYFFSVGSGDRYRNLYPLVHTQGVAEGSRRDRPNKRNLILARAAYLGAQRHGVAVLVFRYPPDLGSASAASADGT